jgi:hypothetical protein
MTNEVDDWFAERHPPLTMMRFADVNEVDAGRGELQAVIRAWCSAH